MIWSETEIESAAKEDRDCVKEWEASRGWRRRARSSECVEEGQRGRKREGKREEGSNVLLF